LRRRRFRGSDVAGCFLSELHAGGEAQFGVDVGEMGLRAGVEALSCNESHVIATMPGVSST
jgi:hypothetical protein